MECAPMYMLCMAWRDPTQICHHIFRYSFLIYFSQSIFRAHSRRIIIQRVFTTFYLCVYFFSPFLHSSFCLWFIFGMCVLFFPSCPKIASVASVNIYGCRYVCECVPVAIWKLVLMSNLVVTCVRYREHIISSSVYFVYSMYLKYHKSKGMTQSFFVPSMSGKWGHKAKNKFVKWEK